MTEPRPNSWRRTAEGKLIPPNNGTRQDLEEQQRRIAAHAARMARAKPHSEAELRALVAAWLPLAKRITPGPKPDEPLMWTGLNGSWHRKT